MIGVLFFGYSTVLVCLGLSWDEQICVGVGPYKASSFHAGVFRCVEHGNLISTMLCYGLHGKISRASFIPGFVVLNEKAYEMAALVAFKNIHFPHSILA